MYVIASVGDNLDGGEVSISTSVVPELDFTYFFTDNLAVEQGVNNKKIRPISGLIFN